MKFRIRLKTNYFNPPGWTIRVKDLEAQDIGAANVWAARIARDLDVGGKSKTTVIFVRKLNIKRGDHNVKK